MNADPESEPREVDADDDREAGVNVGAIITQRRSDRLRMARADPVGEPSQPAAAKSAPTTITVVAMLVINDVPIAQVASAAGLTLSFVETWPTTDPSGHVASDDHREPSSNQSDSREQNCYPTAFAG